MGRVEVEVDGLEFELLGRDASDRSLECDDDELPLTNFDKNPGAITCMTNLTRPLRGYPAKIRFAAHGFSVFVPDGFDGVTEDVGGEWDRM